MLKIHFTNQVYTDRTDTYKMIEGTLEKGRILGFLYRRKRITNSPSGFTLHFLLGLLYIWLINQSKNVERMGKAEGAKDGSFYPFLGSFNFQSPKISCCPGSIFGPFVLSFKNLFSSLDFSKL